MDKEFPETLDEAIEVYGRDEVLRTFNRMLEIMKNQRRLQEEKKKNV